MGLMTKIDGWTNAADLCCADTSLYRCRSSEAAGACVFAMRTCGDLGARRVTYRSIRACLSWPLPYRGRGSGRPGGSTSLQLPHAGPKRVSGVNR